MKSYDFSEYDKVMHRFKIGKADAGTSMTQLDTQFESPMRPKKLKLYKNEDIKRATPD